MNAQRQTTDTPAPRRRRRWVWIVTGILGVATLLTTFLVIDMWKSLGAVPRGERLERIEASPNYDGKFINSIEVQENLVDGLREWMNGGDHRVPEDGVETVRRTGAELEASPPNGLRVTWLGHSTLLVDIDGHRFLTDPVWSDDVSPTVLVGTKRFADPPLPLDELPALDAVVISHDHFDHLDMHTVIRLSDAGNRFVVPLGVGSHLEYWGVPSERITELDWWEELAFDDLQLACTPARHFSGRSPWGKDKTLWAGWAFVGPENRAFFSGDSGMFPGFQEIGDRFGPFQVTMLETGAYGTSWPDVHMGPEQAVQAHTMLRGELLLPIHWGMFNLASHNWTEPVERVLVAAEKADASVVIPRPGESVTGQMELVRWWPKLPWRTAEEAPIVSSGLPEAEVIAGRRNSPAVFDDNLQDFQGSSPSGTREHERTPSLPLAGGSVSTGLEVR